MFWSLAKPNHQNSLQEIYIGDLLAVRAKQVGRVALGRTEPVTLSIAGKVRPGRRVEVSGSTNLPRYDELMISIDESVKGGFGATTKASVNEAGTLRSPPLGPTNGLHNGEYSLSVTVPVARVQPKSVQAVTSKEARAFQAAHPGLRSGLVLAGASNRDGRPGNNDGILTALEISTMNLTGVTLVVLSACETGLGKESRGEGCLGLQRAFQVAGAASTVTSLWKVDDSATRTLMAEFYNQMWTEEFDRPTALRDAQLAMLSRYSPNARKLQPRGLVLKKRPGEPATSRRLSPYYWAAFQYSGRSR